MSAHAGHRERILQKFLKSELFEHEYLEILLFNGLPRKNTNELAHRLLSKFGTMLNLVFAPVEQTCCVEGVGVNVAIYLRIFGMLLEQYMESLRKRSVSVYRGLYDRKKFTEYINDHFKDEAFEVFEIYFLDARRNVYSYHRFMGENNHSVMFQPEELARILVATAPAGVVVVHNHPMGTCDPSFMDDETTKRCQALCNLHNVMFCDHIICGVNGCYSYYDNGKLKNDDTLTQ